MRMRVFPYIHTYIHAYIHTCECSYAHACVSLREKYFHTCIHVHALVYMYTYICCMLQSHTYNTTTLHTYIHTYIRVRSDQAPCNHIHTYIHTYIHTTHLYTHTHNHTCSQCRRPKNRYSRVLFWFLFELVVFNPRIRHVCRDWDQYVQQRVLEHFHF